MAVMLASFILSRASPTERAASVAGVVTKCTVPGTAALTFDDGPYDYIQVRDFTFYFVSNLFIYSTLGI